MTLRDILPSLRHAVKLRIDPTLWPRSTGVDAAGRLTVSGVALPAIADEVGTPAHVLDEADFRYRARRYRKEMPGTKVVYAGKALLTTAVARWAVDEHLGVDVCSTGELATALTGGVDPSRIVFHGDDVEAAVTAGVGLVVVNVATELDYLARHPQKVLVSAEQPGLLQRVLREPWLRPMGLHFHIGTQITDAAVYGQMVRRMIRVMADARKTHGVILGELNLGGGHAVPYVSGDRALDLRTLSLTIDDALDEACATERFPRPTVVVEPGRGLIARAGVTLYRVASTKGTLVTVDGSAPYGTRCTAALANRHVLGPSQPTTIVGSNGVEIVGDADLPCDVHPGDLIAVAGSGAYNHGIATSPSVSLRHGRLKALSDPDLDRRSTARHSAAGFRPNFRR